MRRLGAIWPRIVDPTNLDLALHRAARGKRQRMDVASFLLESERELLQLRRELISHTWQPGGYRCFTIYEGKPRRIWVAPFRDRVVHHALMNVLEPEIDRRLIFDCYACRAGKGTHRAIARYQQFSRRHAYALKLDIVRFFPSVNHAMLKGRLRRLIKDLPTLALCDAIIDSAHQEGNPGRGLPIGNLTSQIWANWYLGEVDHRIVQAQRPGGYLRYVDDFFLFDDSKVKLREIAHAIEAMLEPLGLRLHAHKRVLAPSRREVPVLGFHVNREWRRLPSANAWRARRRLLAAARLYGDGRSMLSDARSRVNAWLGHARAANNIFLCRRVLRGVVWKRATD